LYKKLRIREKQQARKWNTCDRNDIKGSKDPNIVLAKC